MKIELDDQEVNTILAALRYWQQEGLADDPELRSDELHDLATNGVSEQISMCGESIDDLCERLNCPPATSPSDAHLVTEFERLVKLTKNFDGFTSDTLQTLVVRHRRRAAVETSPAQIWKCTICNNQNPADATHCRQCEYSRMVTRGGRLVPRDGKL